MDALGGELLSMEAGRASVRLPFSKPLVGDATRGILHGGVVSALLDNAGGSAVTSALDAATSIATLDLRVDYMKPAISGRTIIAHAHCYQKTRNVAFVRGRAVHEDGGDDVATMAATFMLASNQSRDLAAGRKAAPQPPLTPQEVEWPAAATDGLPEPVRALLAGSPYLSFLGVECRVLGSQLLPRLDFADRLVGNKHIPALHGGVVAAYLETAALMQLVHTDAQEGIDRGPGAYPRTIGFTVQYLRSGLPFPTYAATKVTKHGRRVANVTVEAWQRDRNRPIAMAQGHFLQAPIE